MNPNHVQAQFHTEAQDLVAKIEQELLHLPDDPKPRRIHTLMRSAHTLKGAAASVEQTAIQNVAHVLEDVFVALYNPKIVIDEQVEALLFEGLECLRLLLSGGVVDESAVMNRAAGVIAQLQEKFGDDFRTDNPIPSSSELGFDIVAAMFESGVTQRLESLKKTLNAASEPDATTTTLTHLRTTLTTHANVFLGLAESLNLEGFRAIASYTLAALELNPDRLLEIATVALDDFCRGQTAVLIGDRSQGGTPSNTLRQYAHERIEAVDTLDFLDESTVLDERADTVSYFDQNARTLDFLDESTVLDERADAVSYFDESTVSDERTDTVSYFDQNASTIDFLDESTVFDETTVNDGTINGIDDDKEFAINGGGISAEDPISTIDDIDAEDVDQLIADLAEWEHQLDAPLDTPDTPSGLPSVDVDPLSQDSTRESANEPVQGFTNESTQGDASESAQGDAHEPTSELVNTSVSNAKTGESGQISSVPELRQSHHLTQAPLPLTPIYPQPVQTPSTATPSSPPPSPPPPSSPPPSSPTPDQKDTLRSAPSIRVDLAQLRYLEHLAGELLIKQNGQANDQFQLQSLVQTILTCLRQHNQTIQELWDWSEQTLTLSAHFSPGLSAFNGVEDSDAVPDDSQRDGSTPLTRDALEMDALEMDRHGHLHVLMQSALEDISRLETLMGTVEQLQMRSQRSIKGQKRLLTQTWNTLTHTRMQSLDTIFQRLPRLLRQLTLTYQKQVQLTLPKNEILVDRLLVETVYDALLHLMRNAFDHGIEPPTLRQSRGKPIAGNIWIRAFNQGQHTIIELEDDGAGIDLNAVAQQAITQGLITADQVPHLSSGQIIDFLFHPGFSTASQLSDLSGRGVGLDVVRSQLEQLNGTVNVQSELGQGTRFTLRLPFTLTVLRQMLCRSDGVMYALPVEHIEQVILPKPHQIQASMAGILILQGLLNHQNAPIHLYPLSQLLTYSESRQLLDNLSGQSHRHHHHPYSQHEPSEPYLASSSDAPDLSPILLLRCHQTLVGIMVDEIIAEQELVIRPLDQTITAPSYLHGCSIFNDNQLALVIDPPTLLQQAIESSTSQTSITLTAQNPTAQNQISPPPPPPLPSATVPKAIPAIPGPTSGLTSDQILIVDDSPTVRQTLMMTLEEAGYRTLQAGDGLEALTHLRQAPNTEYPMRPSVIICDIEMPQMDGFQFLTEQRSDPNIAHIPVIMLTSRSGDKHKQIAFELGATEYLTKPCTRDDLISRVQGIAKRTN